MGARCALRGGGYLGTALQRKVAGTTMHKLVWQESLFGVTLSEGGSRGLPLRRCAIERCAVSWRCRAPRSEEAPTTLFYPTNFHIGILGSRFAPPPGAPSLCQNGQE